MNAHFFNFGLLFGWALVLIGTCLLNLPAGLVAGGLLWLLLIALVARIGGIYLPEKAKT